jgi:hypothetical protein
VGTSLYVCKDHNEALLIAETNQKKKERERNVEDDEDTVRMHDLKKNIGKLSNLEKRALYGGDKTILYEKLKIIEK